ITTHDSAIRIISKAGPLANPADRDHCLQYMVAVPLAFGSLTAEHYEDEFHQAHPVIDQLRDRMVISEDPQFSRDYYDPEIRSIANAVQVFFRDGTYTDRVEIHFPVGHRQRRAEGVPLLEEKFRNNLATRFVPARSDRILALFDSPERLLQTPVNE